METTQFGYHMTLDLYECPLKLLSNKDLCTEVLNRLPVILEMHKLIEPVMIEAVSNEDHGGKDPGGFTGFVIIAESHISIHTFPRRGFVSMDIYSCKVFDYKKAEEYLTKSFKPQDKEIHTLDRGSKYPTQNIY